MSTSFLKLNLLNLFSSLFYGERVIYARRKEYETTFGIDRLCGDDSASQSEFLRAKPLVFGDMEHSSLLLENGGRPRTSRTPQLEEAILHAVEEDPSISTRQLAHTQVPDKSVIKLGKNSPMVNKNQQLVEAVDLEYSNKMCGGFCDDG
ncbi:hypothetical protein C0J52_08296 [Blattella germanica]|nr:hypothetical protein C0J52_08296 [Blattella germanica]